MKDLTEIISRINDCILEAHRFSQDLGGLHSIQRDYLVDKLVDLSSTDIHVGLIELTNKNMISYDSDSGLIIVK
jgi:hypothetical protein